MDDAPAEKAFEAVSPEAATFLAALAASENGFFNFNPVKLSNLPATPSMLENIYAFNLVF